MTQGVGCNFDGCEETQIGAVTAENTLSDFTAVWRRPIHVAEFTRDCRLSTDCVIDRDLLILVVLNRRLLDLLWRID